MTVQYKIDDKKIERDIFSKFHPNLNTLETWEQVVNENKEEIEKEQVAIIFKLKEGKFQVITETILLFKLFGEVRKRLKETTPYNQAIYFA